ncbi:MAG: DUF58 domain-containing protein [Gorillibacterium sp.]|nr:DUF58 domain-containing protein [Gorillibacterium sp.]
MGIQWLLIAAFIVIVLQSYVFRKWGLKKLLYSREFNVKYRYAGEEAELIEGIANRKLLPVPWLRVESMILSGLHFGEQTNLDMSSGQFYQNHKSLFSLMPYTKVIRTHRIICKKRGYYRLQSAAMSVGDLLGTPAGTRSFHTSAELYVYPQLADLSGITISSHSFLGDVTVRRWIIEDPFLVSGVREYRYGDSLNRVNWKATARSGRLQVQQRDFTADPRLMLIVNVEVADKMWAAVTDPERIENGLSIAAALVHEAVASGVPVGFGFNGWMTGGEKESIYIEPQGGGEHLTFLLETMAKLVLERVQPIDVLLEADVQRSVTNTDYVIITPYTSPKMQQQLDALADNGNSIEVVLTHSESKTRGGNNNEPQL